MSIPASIDAAGVAAKARSSETESRAIELRQRHRGKTVFLGVDRLDYTKGVCERLDAFELLLERDPQLVDTTVFVQVAVATRPGVPEYDDVHRRVVQRVDQLNLRFGNVVELVHGPVPRPELLALYRVADVALVTPLREGMNLVAKEYVVVQAATDGCGALVLSTSAGAIAELTSAVPCNPFDRADVSNAIRYALALPQPERSRRMSAMAAAIADRDARAWGERLTADLALSTNARRGLTSDRSSP